VPLYLKTGVTAGLRPPAGVCRVHSGDGFCGGQSRSGAYSDDVPFEQAVFIEPLNTVLKGVKLLKSCRGRYGAGDRPGTDGLMHAALPAITVHGR